MADEIRSGGGGDETPDPMAMLMFVQRLMQTAQQGGDMEALMAEAPPGFAGLFEEAQRRAEAGDLPDMSAMMGMFGGLGAMDLDDDAVAADDDAVAADDDAVADDEPESAT